jgi:hypothetical protein
MFLPDNATGATTMKPLGVSQLMSVRGGPERDKDGGPTSRGHFGRGDGARAADNKVCPGELLGHVINEGYDIRPKFRLRISDADGIIAIFARLMHEKKIILTRLQQRQCRHKRTVNRFSPLTSARNKDPKWRLVIPERDLKKLLPYRASGDDGA